MGMGKRARAMIASTVLASTALFAAAPTVAQELVGQPTPGGIGLQPAASPLKVEAHIFHDAILMPIITAICLLVLGLILWIAFRYNKRRNPVPAKWSHNTTIGSSAARRNGTPAARASSSGSMLETYSPTPWSGYS